MKFTVFGSAGFIGSHVAATLAARGVDCFKPSRNDFSSWAGQDLGHVIYAIGVTADFRSRPIDTVRAHAGRLADVLEMARYDSFVYLSSTRLYSGTSTAVEDATFEVDPRSGSDLYNISKLMGESLVSAVAGDRGRVVRLSNVYGIDWSSDNFVLSLIRDAVTSGHVHIRTSPNSAKDYIAIGDAAPLLIAIAERGTRPVYNVATGIPVSNAALADCLRAATGCTIVFEEGAPAVEFPPIDVSAIREDFGSPHRFILDDIPSLVTDFKRTAIR